MSIELTKCPECKLFISLRGYDHHIMRCGEQPMRCRWCDKVHYGGPENCGKPDAEPAAALTAGRQP